ncbi:MAG TPA: Hsp20/alpha crystallin family protein [Candidatus Dormibacteraeota bacterium]|nr:Hsp20/alpha crystallin family protein [Candidatus Dormibacteraeota bacterium]
MKVGMLIWGRSPLLSAYFEEERSGPEVDWRPDLDVFELPQEFVFSLSLPGVDSGDVDVSVLGGTMTVSGQRKVGVPEHAVAHVIESPRGRFMRRLRLPANSEVSGIRLQMADGQLLIHVPKAPPRSVRVPVTRLR